MRYTFPVTLGACVLAFSLIASAQTPAGDVSFAKEAAQAGLAEVELGKLAMERGGDRVKAFGHHMVEDHGKANDELKPIAAAKKITLPTTLDAAHSALRQRLAGQSGAAFDRMYIDAMVTGHRGVAEKVRRESQSGRDPELKAFAAKILPTVEDHLKMALDVQKVLTARTN